MENRFLSSQNGPEVPEINIEIVYIECVYLAAAHNYVGKCICKRVIRLHIGRKHLTKI